MTKVINNTIIAIALGVFALGVFGYVLTSNTAFAAGTCGSCGDTGGTTGGTTGGGGGSSVPVPTCHITASVSTATQGDSYTITWAGTPTNATFKVNNAPVVANDSATYTFGASLQVRFVLTGQNSGGSCEAEVIIKKKTTPVVPVCNITASVSEVTVGGTYTITWAGTPADGIFRVNGFPVAASDAATYTFVGPNQDKFTFTGETSGGTCSDEVIVTKKIVTVPTPVCTLTATPTSIQSGNSSQLKWTSTNAVTGVIDQGIGTIVLTNTAGRSVAPTVNKTYTMTVTNSAGVTATCAATITVTTTVPAPVCTLTAAPSTIVSGNSSQLKWTSTNAVTGVIDQGIGAIVLTNTAGRSVAPTVNKTYTMTVTNSAGVTATCNTTVTVTTPDAPLCDYFNANPVTINRGDSTVLSWGTTRADSASINNGIGSVAVDGTYTVSPLENTTYTLSLVGVGGTTQCNIPVTVTQPHSNLSCAANVNFYADDTSITDSDSTTLHWDTNGVTSVSLTDYGSVSLDGSQSVSPSSDRTYNLTASNGSDSVSCPVTIDVSSDSHHHSSSPSPRCSLKISDATISLGERTTLTWDTSNAFDLTLKDNYGKTLVTTEDRSSSDKSDLYDGEMTLRPEKDTTYTLHVERGSKDEDCDVKVDVSDVVVSQIRDQQPLVSGIALTQVPYTGFEAGPIMTFIFYGLLALWALYLAYVLVVRRGALSFTTGAATTATTATSEHIVAATTATPHSLFTPTMTATPVFHQTTTPVATVPSTATVGYDAVVSDATEIETMAHAAKVLLSADAVQAFVSATPAEIRTSVLATVLATAKGTYPTEDGWVILGEERMKALLTA